MAKTVKVTLIDPIEGHGEVARDITFKEPGWREYSQLGEPFQPYRSADGSVFVVEKDEVILKYMEMSVQAPANPVMLNSLSLADAIQCREAFLGFFGEARARIMNAPATS